jgi:methylenetetrahydrofolate reductase (NADPH)
VSLTDKIVECRPGVLLYGLAPPKRDTGCADLERIAAQQVARLQALQVDGLIIYDLQDEAERIAAPTRFRFYPPSIR